MEDFNTRYKKFIEGLDDLSKRYKLSIGGCGCCGSPYLTDLVSGKFCADNLKYDEKNHKYTSDVDTEFY